MTATHITASTVLVAIDISKHRHEVLIGIPGKKRRRRLTITNTLADFLFGRDLAEQVEQINWSWRQLAGHLGNVSSDLHYKLVAQRVPSKLPQT